MKKIMYVVGGLLALSLLLALLIPTVVDAEKFRPLLQSKMEQKLRRKVSFGRVSWNLFPVTSVAMDDFRLQDPNLPAGKDLLRASSIRIVVDPLSYLTKDAPDIKSIEINDPTVELNEALLRKIQATPSEDGNASAGAGSGSLMKNLDLKLNALTVQYWGNSSESQPAVSVKNMRARFWDPNPPEGNPFQMPKAEMDLAGSTIVSSYLSVPVQVDAGAVQLIQNRVLLEQLKASLGGTPFQGKIRVESMAEPVVRFDLLFPDLQVADLERWKSPSSTQSANLSAGNEAAAGGSSIASKPQPDIQGAIGVERLAIGSGQAQKVAMQVRWAEEKLTIDRLQGEMYGGRLVSSGHIQYGAALPSYQLKTEVRDALLERITARENNNKSSMEGNLDLDAQLTGSGLDFRREKTLQDLRASGNFTIRRGKINAFDLSEKLKFLNALAKMASGDGSLSSEIQAQSDFQFDGREIRSRAMETRVGLLSLLMNGYFTPKGYMDYQVNPKLQQPAGGGRDTLFGAILGVVSGATQSVGPFRVRGTLDNLEVIL